MHKNIAIVLLACACLFLGFQQYSVRKDAAAARISAADYGGLLALRDALSPDEYKNVVLPYLEKGEALTRAELDELSVALGSLPRQVLEAAGKVRPQEALARAMDDALQSASDLGGDISRGMRDALNDLSRRLNEARPSPESAPEGSQPPTQL